MKLVTNVDLYQWQVKENTSCTFCQQTEESIVHVLFECENSKIIWNAIQKICEENNIKYNDNLEDKILYEVVENTNSIIDLVCVMTKQLIYYWKCQGKMPSLILWKRELILLYDVELYNARNLGILKKFKNKWNPISRTIQSWKSSL